MGDTVLSNAENVKLLRSDEALCVGKQSINSKDAMSYRLPENYTVIPMKVLEKPEPIKRRRK